MEEILSLALVSDNITHSKETTVVYIDKVIEIIFEKFPVTGEFLIEKLHFFSDNSASQFKNRYLMKCIKQLQNVWDISVEWNFFQS